jgi:ankyrin repeat protein
MDRAGAINEILDEYEKDASPLYQQDHILLLCALSKMKSDPPMHPEYAKARKRLIHFLEKNSPKPWPFNQEVDTTHRSPLTYAVYTKQKDLIALMIKKGADINTTDPGNWTPLQRAIAEGDKDMVSFLIKNGASLTDTQGQGSPIHTALKHNRTDIAAYLLTKMKTADIDLNISSPDGIPLIHQAANTSKSAVEILKNQGADLNVRDRSNYTTLQIAIMAGKTDVVQYLIAQGMPLDNDPLNGIGPLQLAIYYGNIDLAKEIAQQMRQKSIPIMSRDSFHQSNFVELATSAYNQQFFDEMGSFGISLDPQEKADCLDAAITTAADPATSVEWSLEFIKFLINKLGINLNTPDSGGYLPIETALSEPDTPGLIIEYFIDRMAEKGANVYARRGLEDSIYDQAKAHGRTDITQYIDRHYPQL